MFGTLIVKGISAWWSSRQALKKAEIENAQKRLAAGLGDKYIKLQYITFGMLVFPFVLAFYAPETSTRFWKSVAEMPLWFVETFIYILLAIWGYSVAQKGVMQMIGSLQKWHRDVKKKK